MVTAVTHNENSTFGAFGCKNETNFYNSLNYTLVFWLA